MASLLPALCVSVGMSLVLLAAFWVDRLWGEPPVAMHPVVWMGKYLQICGGRIARLPPVPAFALGALAWLAACIAIAWLAWQLQKLFAGLLAALPGLFEGAGFRNDARLLLVVPLFLLMAWLTKTMFSWRMLCDEAGAVEAALDGSLEAGQLRLSWLVSRDTSTLDETQVRESAIETLAENLNDSVVAPIFWFVLFGLPGAAVYRFANTADAMWGYRGIRNGIHWEWAGKWAAFADDALSWLPARLTAALMLVASGIKLRELREEARKTPSPNSGWPMAAMALALGVCLRKPGVYALNPGGRAAESKDTFLAQKYASKVVAAAISWAGAAIILIAFVKSS